MNENAIFTFDGGVGDILFVYDDRIVIQHKGVLNLFAMGLKGDKTIYFNNITSVQLKKAGWTAGYLQFSILGGRESVAGVLGATQDENTITFNSNKNDEAETIAEHINKKLSEFRNGIMQHQTASITPASSPADEIRKYKELLDMDAITKEEFDLKKKQILGL